MIMSDLHREELVSKAVSSAPYTAGSGQANSNGAPALPNLPFTGERMMPGQVLEPLFLEHEARYVFASKFVKGQVVLDVACGAGIGTHFLLKAGARSCLGLDIDGATIAEARATYKGCQFEQCDATHLCVSDSSIDVIVSFETIEHLTDQMKFLSECKRVLKPSGILVCSTPNRTMTRWAPGNPYHLHEFTVAEFRGALESKFIDVQLFAQQNANQLRYASERLLSRALHALQVMGTAKRLLRWKFPPPAVRTEFGGLTADPDYEIRPYRRTLLVQPRYVIAVARKSS